MKTVRIGRKALKVAVVLAALLLAAAILTVVATTNQKIYLPTGFYIQQGGDPNTATQQKMEIGSNYDFTSDIYEPIIVMEDNIVIDGHGHHLTGSGTGCGFNLTGRTNVTIKNVIVTGWQYGFYLYYYSSNNTLTNNTAYNNWNGFRIYGSNNTLTNNTAYNNWNGFRIYGSNNTLINNTANNNDETGFELYGGSNNTLINNTANNNIHVGFKLSSSGSNNTLINNTANNNTYAGGFYISGPYNTLINNTANNNHAGGFSLYSSYNTLINNTANNNHFCGFDIYYSSYNTLINNTANNNNNTYAGGFCISGPYNTLTNNTAYNNYYGFRIYGSNNTLTNNTANNNNWNGFYLYYGSNNTLINNTANNNIHAGFELSSSGSNNTLINNTANNNKWVGFKLYGGLNSTLIGNVATNSGVYGFCLDSSSYNNLTCNTAIDGVYGFYLANSSSNNLHSNWAINCITPYYLGGGSVGNDLVGSVVANYLRVRVLGYDGVPLQDAHVKVEVDGNLVYATPGFGGSNSTTDVNGLIGLVPVAFQTYVSGGTMVENVTNVTVSFGGLHVTNSPRVVNMSSTHVETFIVDNVPPTVIIAAPATDASYNFGPILYITGYYNGTGSSVSIITCNDSRFSLSQLHFGDAGVFCFVNNSAIPTSNFWVNISVRDGSGLEGFALRHVIVNHTLVEASIMAELSAGLNQFLNASTQMGVELSLDLTAPISISIVKIKENMWGNAPPSFTFFGRFVAIAVNDTTAISGVTITFHYTDQEVRGFGLPENVLKYFLAIWYWDEASGTWVMLPSTVNPWNNTVRANANHLTLFTVVLPNSAPSPIISSLVFSFLLSVQPILSPTGCVVVGVIIVVQVVAAGIMVTRKVKEWIK
ncbi:MAG: right-handed parallel beta-helix repeat-containing protein [Candidatus Freyarchaeota archaeon]|nr:right-handed parallel beta-helix repeat-containing protein [Candidatus Jordarchaeia archaeon]